MFGTWNKEGLSANCFLISCFWSVLLLLFNCCSFSKTKSFNKTCEAIKFPSVELFVLAYFLSSTPPENVLTLTQTVLHSTVHGPTGGVCRYVVYSVNKRLCCINTFWACGVLHHIVALWIWPRTIHAPLINSLSHSYLPLHQSSPLSSRILILNTNTCNQFGMFSSARLGPQTLVMTIRACVSRCYAPRHHQSCHVLYLSDGSYVSREWFRDVFSGAWNVHNSWRLLLM